MSPKQAKQAKQPAPNPVVEKLLKDGDLILGNDPELKLETVTTGIPDIDAILNGGIPRKRLTILVGAYSSCKSFLIQTMMKKGLEDGLTIAYIDTEQSFDPAWWEQVGLPLGSVLVSQPPTGEKAVEVLLALVGAGIDIIAVDSLAALVPMEEAEQGPEKKQIGLQARLINKMMRQLLTLKHRSAIVFTNQVRDAIGNTPNPLESMPGGKGQLHFSSLIIRFQREGWIEEKGKRTGFNLRLVVRKSKIGSPWGECTLPFHFRGEIDMLALLVDRAVEAGLITQAGPWYRFTGLVKEGEEPIRLIGKNKVIDLLRDDEGMRNHVETALGDT